MSHQTGADELDVIALRPTLSSSAQRDAGDLGLEDQPPVHDTLGVGDNSARTIVGTDAQDVEPGGYFIYDNTKPLDLRLLRNDVNIIGTRSPSFATSNTRIRANGSCSRT